MDASDLKKKALYAPKSTFPFSNSICWSCFTCFSCKSPCFASLEHSSYNSLQLAAFLPICAETRWFKYFAFCHFTLLVLYCFEENLHNQVFPVKKVFCETSWQLLQELFVLYKFHGTVWMIHVLRGSRIFWRRCVRGGTLLCCDSTRF